VNHIDTDHEDGLHRCVGGDQPGRDGDLRRKGGAGTVHIESAGILCAEFVLQNNGSVRRDVVRGRRADNNQVNIFRFPPCALERLFGGGKGEVGCHPVLRGIKALIDTRAARELVDDVRPSQRGETRRQFRVAHDVLGQIASGGDNLRNAGHQGPLQKCTLGMSYSVSRDARPARPRWVDADRPSSAIEPTLNFREHLPRAARQPEV
jgi:hypothetical protein